MGNVVLSVIYLRTALIQGMENANKTGLTPGARILEQSVLWPHYDAVLTILVIPEQIEDWGDDDGELDPKEFSLGRTRWRK